ncbi:uncharacterized protein LOC142290834 [Anomaloglossus baeobatrachus]|uniref:uncharacterized protein LOC142290834 n=1 Tax=Anomaloglossus baeobatrachus TaxID=238106 RepID=UPI003F4F7530
MAHSFYERCSWLSCGLREKTSSRRGCCDLLRFCRSRPRILDFSPDPACVHGVVKLLDELLADGGCARAVSCRCGDSLQDSFSLAAALSSTFEDECRPRGAVKFLLQMDLLRHWHRMTNAVPRLQELLEVCCPALVPQGWSMCLSCRERQEELSEVSSGKFHKPSNRQAAGRRSGEHRTAASFKCVCSPEETGGDDLPGAEERSGHRLKPQALLLSSAQQLKNSLKKDLETHQLYLGAIETRLSGLERRAQDVTKRLERANLELEAIKQGSVTLKTLVDEPIPSPVTEDPGDDLWEDLRGSRVTGKKEIRWAGVQRSCEKGLYRRKDLERRCARRPPAGGVHVQHRGDAQSGLSSCQRHVDVLIQQITRQINQMESDIRVTSELRQNAR